MTTPRFYALIHSCNLLRMMYNESIESKVLFLNCSHFTFYHDYTSFNP